MLVFASIAGVKQLCTVKNILPPSNLLAFLPLMCHTIHRGKVKVNGCLSDDVVVYILADWSVCISCQHCVESHVNHLRTQIVFFEKNLHYYI